MNKIQELLYWLFDAKPSGLLPTPPDDRDFQLGIFGLREYKPKHTRLELPTLSYKNQKNLNTCGWNAAIGTHEPDEGKVLSVRSLVSYARLRGLINGNGYSNLRDNQKALADWGAAEETLCQDTGHEDWEKYSRADVAKLTENANTHKIKTFWSVNDRNAMMKALDEGHRIEVGIDWYTGFNQGGGFSRPWLITKPVGYKVGGHALCIIGYDLNYHGYKVWIVQNSYGPNWGDNGKFYMTMDFFDTQNAYGAYTNLDMEAKVVDILTEYFAQNVKGDKSPGIYYIYGGQKHAYPDEDTWMSFDAEKDGFTVVPQADLDKVPEGEPMKKEAGQNWGLIQKIKKPFSWRDIFTNKR